MAFFDDPLTRRELSGVARRWQPFVARLVVGVVIAWAVGYLWERSTWTHRYGGDSAMAALSREVFAAYFGGLMGFVPLVAISAASDLITREVRNGTLGLLFLTPLTPWRIAAGKWKAAMAQALMILLAGGPVAAICVFLGGIGAWDLLWSAALPLATAGFAAAVSLFFSTVFRGPGLTVIVSILTLVAGTLVPSWLMMESRGEALEFLAWIHPAFAALVAAVPQIGAPPDVSLYAWISASGVAASASALVLAAAAARLPGRVSALPGPGLASRLMAGLDGFFESINVGRVRFFTRSGGVWEDRVLLWKELRLRATGKFRHATRFAVGLLVLSILPFLGSAYELREWMAVFLWAFAGLLVLQAVVGGVSLFTHEREGRQWDVLLSTPLTTDDILWAKVVGGLSGLAPTAVAAQIYVFMIASVQHQGAAFWFVATVPALLFTLFAFLFSAAASLRARTYRGAFGMSMGVVLAVLVGIPMAGAALDELPGWRVSEQEVMAPTNPGWYLAQVSERLYSYGYDTGLGRDAPYLFFYVCVYGIACFSLVHWMRWSFDRAAGRV